MKWITGLLAAGCLIWAAEDLIHILTTGRQLLQQYPQYEAVQALVGYQALAIGVKLAGAGLLTMVTIRSGHRKKHPF